jgi:neural Wiskott-Aldrich syndrome protein
VRIYYKCTNCASACKRCDEARPCQRCQKYGLGDSCVDGVRKARKVGIKRGPYKRKSKLPVPEATPYPGQSITAETLSLSHKFAAGFPPNGEGSWVPPSDQTNGAPPGAVPAIPPQYLPEGYWPYPYYPPPPGYVPPTPESSANGDSASHGQPPHHPAYYPIHPGYSAVPIYPPPPGAYGPIPTPSGQAPPAPTAEQTAGNQTATSDDERPVIERSKKKKRAGGEDGGSKSTKKSKRSTNAVNEAPVVLTGAPAAPPSDDSPDDHGSPVAHNTSGVGGEPLPPVIAAA